MPLNESELRELIDDLLTQWEDASQPRTLHQPADRRGQRVTGSDASRIMSVYGLARHVHETARAIDVLIKAGHANAAIPLVRVAYESALTAAWLVQSKGDHGIKAFLHEHSRIRLALKKESLKALSDIFRTGADQIADADPELFKDTRDNAQRFYQLCLDLAPGGQDAYIHYRLLSAHSHASIDVVDLYLHPMAPNHQVPSFRAVPQAAHPNDTLLFFTAASMVWAGRAYSYLTRDKQHRTALRQSAQLLEIDPELQLSENYRRRHASRMAGSGSGSAGHGPTI
ncbi:DUF5677 domain-containing protein [Diaminobutyricimonas sp. LJ205]|uniref:DUF6988 family protein n=1 Tax=Diaminobutyricimonas sp. LJ205 TaxID=2683590 RepID=UPI0012F5167D|nr:DUF5677 domain-containing protein [Diaminobutyricimonas sp. LJ205]